MRVECLSQSRGGRGGLIGIPFLSLLYCHFMPSVRPRPETSSLYHQFPILLVKYPLSITTKTITPAPPRPSLMHRYSCNISSIPSPLPHQSHTITPIPSFLYYHPSSIALTIYSLLALLCHHPSPIPCTNTVVSSLPSNHFNTITSVPSLVHHTPLSSLLFCHYRIITAMQFHAFTAG